MFSPLLAGQAIDISDMPQSTGSNKHIWRISRPIYPKSLLASYILLFGFDYDSDAVRSGSSDEDVASPIILQLFQKGFLSKISYLKL
jgi:hypothetical protein